jgi:serine/threonine protein kinase
MIPDDAPTEDDLSSFRAALSDRGVDVNTLQANHKGTLFSPEPPAELRAMLEEADDLPVLQGIRLKEPIGKGGMGIVYAAEQAPLTRDVAVKLAATQAEEGSKSAGPARELIYEARVTGRLAHPNVIPVHALGRTEDGDVVLVMKRVDGAEWSKLLRRQPDDLERHLEIFMDVCRAVELAHEQGVLHRDLKPANVMVGRHDEVYLLDWGLAVATDVGAGHGIPLASEVSDLVGTPAYMAPEMVLRERLSEATDIFLLGAVLHEVVAGAPPWSGDNTVEVLLNASRCAPPDLDDVPGELRAVLTRALARRPEDRFASARELREAVAAFIKHESARQLVRAGEEIRERLEELSEDELDEQLVRARFAYEQSLEMWPENPDARAGLADLETRAAEMREEIKRLKRRARDNDFRVGRGQRAPFIIVFGLLWGALCIAAGALEHLSILPAYPVLIAAVLIVIAGWLGAYAGRVRAGRANRADKTTSLVTVGWIGVYALILGLCWWAAIPLWLPLVLGHLNFVIMQLLMGLAFNRQLLKSIPPIFLSAIPLLIWQEQALWIHGSVFGFMLAGVGLWLMREHRKRSSSGSTAGR